MIALSACRVRFSGRLRRASAEADPAGCTLIELLAVLLILALLTTAVSLSLASAQRKAQMRDVIDQITQYDLLARVEARQHGQPLRLAISLLDAKLSRLDAQSGGARENRSSLVLPSGYSIGEIRLPRKRTNYGQASVNISILGQTPDYALLVRGPDEQKQWLFFTGLSGQSTLLSNDREIADTFQALFGGPEPR